jgi:hypothetical protein
MRRIANSIPHVLLLGVAFSASGQDKSPTPTEQFAALKKELNLPTGSGGPLTDAERLKFVGRAYNHRFVIAEKFVALAEKYPNDPVALEALFQAVWQVNGTPWPVEIVGQDTARSKAFEIIVRDHIKSDKLGPLCQRVSWGFAKEYETFLRAVTRQNPHKPMQAIATVSLGQYLNGRAQRIELCREQPELRKDFDGLFGRGYVEEQLKQDPAKVVKEAESLFIHATEKFGDVKLSDSETVADRAKTELYALRNLSVGKEAPETGGEDEDGKQFKLSDYRGKVVLLDFWSFV